MSDSEDDTAEKQLKIVFVGEANVGKTNIIKRFCYNEYSRMYNQTIGADFHIKRVILPGRKEVTLKITDIGGLELNGNMLDNYLFNSNLIILVYDITNPSSFDYLNVWIQSIANIMDSPPIVAIIGNKVDNEHQRVIKRDKVNQFSKEFELSSYNVSAKTGEFLNASILDIISKHLGIPLSKVEKEYQQPIIKAELTPKTPTFYKTNTNKRNNSAICNIQ